MQVLKFEGASDDTFGYDFPGYGGDDWDNCASGKPIEFLVQAPNGDALVVVGQYGHGACDGWMVGIARPDVEDDDTPIPAWPMHFEQSERPYSPTLVIEAPDGVVVSCFQKKK